MIKSNYTVQVIEPSEGYFLTQKSNPGNIMSKKVFLAINDSIENWIEVTEEEVKDMEPIEEIASLD